MPSPSGLDNGFRIFELGFPAEAFLGFCGVCDEFGGIAGASGRRGGGDGETGDLAGGFENFFDGETASGTEIDGTNKIGEKGAEVGIGEVCYMDIVADASAIRGRIIIAKDFEFLLLSESDLEDIRNDMGFDGMIFTEVAFSAAGVEIAEEDRAETMDFGEPLQHFLQHEFGVAVGVCRILDGVFRNGEFFRLSVCRASRGEDDAFASNFKHGIDEIDATDIVIPVVFSGMCRGLPDECVCREVHDGVRKNGFQGGADIVFPAKVSDQKPCAGIDCFNMTQFERVEDDDLVAGIQQMLDRYAADIAGSAGDEDFHSISIRMNWDSIEGL